MRVGVAPRHLDDLPEQPVGERRGFEAEAHEPVVAHHEIVLGRLEPRVGQMGDFGPGEPRDSRARSRTRWVSVIWL